VRFHVIPLSSEHRCWENEFVTKSWGSTKIVTRGKLVDAASLPGLVAVSEHGPVGLLTYCITGDECEIVTLNSLVEGQGVGSALIGGIRTTAVSSGCRRLWLITTNDNLPALRFYQKRGFNLLAVHCNALEYSRRLKPQISLIGLDGIRLRDEIELEMPVGPAYEREAVDQIGMRAPDE
jgi:hypothetical protein